MGTQSESLRRRYWSIIKRVDALPEGRRIEAQVKLLLLISDILGGKTVEEQRNAFEKFCCTAEQLLAL